MKNALLVIVCGLILSASAGRRVVSLSGPGWTCDGEEVSVPHTWNGIDGADGSSAGLPPPRHGMSIGSCDSYVRKAAVYTRALPDPTPGMRQFIRFGGVSLKATVKVNGEVVGSHVGAFTVFTVEATGRMKPKGNVLEVVADNRPDPDVAPLSADYTLMGGVYRDVEWIETPQVCIDPVTDGADGVTVNAGMDGDVRLDVRVLGGTNETRMLHYDNPELWTPENPRLYTARVAIESGDEVSVRFGFRSVEFRDDGFYLNGVKRKLRGVNRHQDSGDCGWAATSAEEERDLRMIKELGADAVRLAHYPQSRRVYDLCDELGLLVWSEVPAINWLSKTAAFKDNLLLQAHEMVAQVRNHPCVFAWSIFNEIYNDVPEDRNEEGWMEAILEDVKAQLKAEDPLRPVVAASDRPARRRLNGISDELAFNAYPGWYGDTTMRDDIDNWFAASGRGKLCISEYGAGGNPWEHLDPLPEGRLDPGGPIHPEETQVKLHAANYREILHEPRLWGAFIWAMFDFAADARREGGKNGINDKGLVTRDRVVKKDVYYLYKANWSKAPVLYVCSKRQEVSTNGYATVVGFSNVGRVELFVNGEKTGECEPDEVKVVRWERVNLAPGANEIVLKAGGLEDARSVSFRRQEGSFAMPSRHCKVTVWELRDRTDEHNELLFTREWLTGMNERAFDVRCPLLAVENVLTGEGTAYLRLAPLPHARSRSAVDFTVDARAGTVVCHDTGYPLATIPYKGGSVGRIKALQDYQRRLRPYVPGRDGLLMSNTWGDRNKDRRINERFLLGEIDAAAELGVEVVQVDDGWQTGKSMNSAFANGEGVWNGYWAANPGFWRPDPARFPHGLGYVTGRAREKGIGFGLWFGPDSSNEAANWSRDADCLLALHRECGVDYFKLDSMKTTSDTSFDRQRRLVRRLIDESNGRIVVDLDVTAEVRPGYFGFPEAGPVFVENRYSDWTTYWPHLTLRTLWSLAEVVDPVRLRLEFLNPVRKASEYGDDPLAPQKYPADTLFACVMASSPLAWFETSGLDPATFAAWKPLIAKWKEHRDGMFGCWTIPVLAKPDGVSWTGFVFVPRERGNAGYALLFRELSPSAECTIDISKYFVAKSVEVLSPRGNASLSPGELLVELHDPLDFIWLRLPTLL